MIKNKLQTVRIGAHVSVAGGFDLAIERAHKLGANCMQIFAGSPRTWVRVDLSKIDLQKLFSIQKDLDVTPIITHALYLINLASDKPETSQKSYQALKADLTFDAYIKGGGVVVHLGSHQGRGWDAVKDGLLDTLIKLLKETPEESKLLIENSAGQKGKLSSDLAEIKWLLEALEKKSEFVSQNRVGWCFDTCHAWAAGYYLGQKPPSEVDTTKNPVRGRAIDEIKRLDLLNTLACVHVNGSRDSFASGKDRHANLGEGLLSLEDIAGFINLPEIKKLPLILETPGLKKPETAKMEVEKLKELMTKHQ